jgi:hypothetical protein
METVSRQEILVAYLCVISTVALLLWSRVSGRDYCGPRRAGQSEPAPPTRAKLAPAPSSRDAVYAQSAFGRSDSDLRTPEARAGHGVREPAFSSSPPALTGIRNRALGRAPSSAQMRAKPRAGVQQQPPCIDGDTKRRAWASALVRSDAREPARGFAAPERPCFAGDERAHPWWDAVGCCMGWGRAARWICGVRSDARERARGARDARGPSAAAGMLSVASRKRTGVKLCLLSAFLFLQEQIKGIIILLH